MSYANINKIIKHDDLFNKYINDRTITEYNGGKKQLLKKATELSIKGRSKMNKEELIKSINKQENEINETHKALAEMMKKTSKKFKIGADISKIDAYFHKICIKAGYYPSCLNHEGFPKSSCISVNDQVCHCVPYPYKLKDGDIVTLDICANKKYYSDMAETFCIGNVSAENRKLVDATKQSLYNAIEICKPGEPYKNIGAVISKYVKDNGFVLIDNFGGHTIGTELHMKPYISNHINNTSEIMKVGDTFAIEPLVTIKSGKTINEPDGLGIRTKNGKNAAHFERCILITESGHKILNEFSY